MIRTFVVVALVLGALLDLPAWNIALLFDPDQTSDPLAAV